MKAPSLDGSEIDINDANETNRDVEESPSMGLLWEKEGGYKRIDEQGDASQKSNFRIQWLHWLAHALLGSLLCFSVILNLTPATRLRIKGSDLGQPGQDYLRPFEAFWDESPNLSLTHPEDYNVSHHYQTTTATTHNNTTTSPHNTPPSSPDWKGAPSILNTPLWNSLVSVGFVSTQPHEIALLDFPTARNIRSPDEFVLTPQVYHDLHCLQMLRLQFWRVANDTSPLTHSERVDLEVLTPHYDHCIDSLRKTLMCASDLTPMQWHWNKRKMVYQPTWDVPRTCRNFGAIQEWATRRNSTGMVPVKRPGKEEVEGLLDGLRRRGEKMPWDP